VLQPCFIFSHRATIRLRQGQRSSLEASLNCEEGLCVLGLWRSVQCACRSRSVVTEWKMRLFDVPAFRQKWFPPRPLDIFAALGSRFEPIFLSVTARFTRWSMRFSGLPYGGFQISQSRRNYPFTSGLGLGSPQSGGCPG
jgi:hypothetical protein